MRDFIGVMLALVLCSLFSVLAGSRNEEAYLVTSLCAMYFTALGNVSRYRGCTL